MVRERRKSGSRAHSPSRSANVIPQILWRRTAGAVYTCYLREGTGKGTGGRLEEAVGVFLLSGLNLLQQEPFMGYFQIR